MYISRMVRTLQTFSCVACVMSLSSTMAAPVDSAEAAVLKPLHYTGVNISGGEFDNPQPGKPTTYGTNYTYPSASEMDYFASKGVNVFRFPFQWPDLQPTLNAPLDTSVLGHMKDVVKLAAEHGQIVLLDPHDYARYYGKVVGTADVPDSAFANFWGQVATAFKNDPHVWFGLMNEPHDLPAAQWLGSANAAIAAIRKAGANNLILVPGIAWTGAGSWISSGNGATMLGIVDPMHRYVFEVHQYLDSNSSGTHAEVVSETIGSERLAQFTAWCKAHHERAFLGEFGAADNPASAAAVTDMLTNMEQNQDVWIGFTWWAAGAWWGDYMYTVEPKNGQDRPQMAVLRPFLQKNPVTAATFFSPTVSKHSASSHQTHTIKRAIRRQVKKSHHTE